MTTAAPVSTLASVPALPPLLARGALLSPFKRPRPDADFPRARLVVPRLRAAPARLAAYERVCGFATGADTLPVTYPHVMGFPLAMRLMSGRDFPLPLLGLVHTSIAVTRRAPVPAGGEYGLAVHVAELVPHRRGTEAAVVTELRSGGEVVWESRSTYLARHGGSGKPSRGGGREGRVPGSPSGGDGAAERDGRPAGDGGREGRVPGNTSGNGNGHGDGGSRERRVALPVRAEWRPGGDLGRRYGAASGDRNPIHLHPLTARLFGFPRAIAHGMWTVARCLAEHGTPEAVTVRAEFRAPVLLPGTVTYGAEGGRFELRGPDGRLHLSGEVQPV
ncbi:MaoC/PaaZ C-terminal domain-containing protein [Streptomyces griseoviridis]|uniref:MaoC-like domain-containing protein n=1 Tax=Streptomyces griseoviridis TaxID=45398 RepID=A0A918GRA4_STRGD|nr:MaoC/PaaZ C-terminal domain-containing protein [Streptomyces niveoruber]GGS54674.1 hypothetical protein GCM10010238_50090 [Streptomyces niveoruber]